LTVEEAYLLATYIRGIRPDALLVLGPIPVSGEDETFAKGFTIRAEKCPNRKGVEAVLTGVTGAPLVTWSEFLDKHLPSGSYDGVWVSGGYVAPWNDTAVADRFAAVKTLVVQDFFSSPLMETATWQLPAAAFAERDGSYVNHADRLQSFEWAVRAPAGVKVEGHLYWQLAGRTGLFRSRAVLDDVARAIGYFSAATGAIPDVGLDLKVNQLAGAS
jgi:NADH-quinone oxidoreductase subunit G